MNRALVSITGVSAAFIVAACDGTQSTGPGDQSGAGGDGGGQAGGAGAMGGGTMTSHMGGTTAGPTGGANANPTGGANAGPTGGANANPTGGANAGPTGGANANPTGGANAGPTGGANANPTGGAPSTGPTGGRAATGGTANNSPTGGMNGNPTGGAPSTGSTGGKASTGGTSASSTGGTTSATATGGAPAAGGSTGTTTGCVVQLGSTHQTIQGFGINDTWATAMTASVADALFNATSGIGLTILRVGLGTDGTTAPMSANIPGDITIAKSHGATKIIGSCWSPAASCKSNNSVNDGGHVLTTCYDSWSTTITNFAKNNGLYAMSIANEPDFASCGTTDPCNGNYPTTLFTANEMVTFVKIAGPKLQAAGIKVIAPEASEWTHQWSNTSAGPDAAGKNSSDPLKCGFPPATTGACTTGGGYDYGHYLAKDAAAWAAIDIMGVHEYDSQKGEPWPSDVTAARKEVWQTEMSGVKWWPEQGPSSDINNGVAVAGWIHSALVTGEASAWLWWWYQASSTDDNEGLLLKSGTDTKRHYTLGNYSKFVRPGYVMVDVTGNSNTNVLLSAFKGTDGTVAIVAVNKGTSAATIPISITGGTAPGSCTPTVTSSTDNLAAKAAVTVAGGSFTASLAATTVTTFVCK